MLYNQRLFGNDRNNLAEIGGHTESYLSRLRSSIHQLRLRVRNMPQSRKAFVFIVVPVCCFIIYRILVYLLITDLSYHTDTHNCPACYGTRMCKRIQETSVHGIEGFHHINYLTNVKNVYFGKLNNDEFVFKKLAHDDELSAVDDYLCHGGLTICSDHHEHKNKYCVSMDSQSEENSCDIQQSAGELKESLTGPLLVEEVVGLSDAVQCPSSRLVQRMVNRYQERGHFVHEDGLSAEEKLMLLYTLSVNPEPIILQMFPSGEGWPFPAYIGACGRMIAEENAGVSLREYFYADWETRVKLSLNLLKIADHLTDNASGFKLYFTDISLDNYAVRESDLSVVILDAENIIIVDEQYLHEAKLPGYDKPLKSEHSNCKGETNCLVIDVDGLCSAMMADFNYYAVCRGLLSPYAQDENGMSGGLLHSPPPDQPQAKSITKLAKECAQPSADTDRFVVKEHLMDVLEAVVKSYSQKKTQ